MADEQFEKWMRAEGIAEYYIAIPNCSLRKAWQAGVQSHREAVGRAISAREKYWRNRAKNVEHSGGDSTLASTVADELKALADEFDPPVVANVK